MTPPTQVRVFGRYHLHRQLGQGGMGTVYLAHDTALNRWVALKIPDLSSRNRTKVLERFRREARVAASIEHPNVCPILDIGEINGAAYLTMPFIRGTSLGQRLDSDHPWPPGDAAVLITKLAGALGAMHAKGLIHRDLKPGNVLVREPAVSGADHQAPGEESRGANGGIGGDGPGALVGEPVLVDFGLARSFSDPTQRLTHMGQRLGTPAYMSPEQVMGAVDQGPATDIYALGVIFYELLTGHVPFEGGSVEMVYAWILQAKPVPPSERCPSLGPTEDALVLRALAKDPAQRYASMTEFAQALRRYLQENQGGGTLPPSSQPTSGERGEHSSPQPRSNTPSSSPASPPTAIAGAGSTASSTRASDQRAARTRPVGAASRIPWGIWLSVGLAGVLLVSLLVGVLMVVVWPQSPPGTKPTPSGARAELTLEPLGRAQIRAGEKTTLKVRIQRENCPGAVELRLGGKPDGLDVAPRWIPHDANEVEVTVTASSNVAVGQHKIRVQALAGTVQATQLLVVDVMAASEVARLTLLPVSSVSLVAGDRDGSEQTVRIRIRREHCPGEVQVRAMDLPAGVNVFPASIGMSSEEGNLRIRAADTAKAGRYEVRLRALSGQATAEGTFPLVIARRSRPTFSRTVTVASKDPRADYQGIGQALRAVPAGARVVVKPGLYRETIVLDKQVTVVGDGKREEIIVESTDSNCLRMETDRATVKGLTLRGRAGAKGLNYYAVNIGRGQLVLEDCDITSNSLACVCIHGETTAPTLRKCKIHDGKRSGIWIRKGGKGTIEDCQIFANTFSGIHIEEKSNPTVRRCKIYGGKSSGIWIHKESKGTIENCDIFGNAKSGIHIQDKSTPTVRGCTIHDVKSGGIWVSQGGGGLIADCDIYANAKPGIHIQERSNPTIRGCKIHDGKQNGIWVSQGGGGLIEDCDIYANAYPGIDIEDKSHPTLRKCKIYDGKQNGIWIRKGAKGTIVDCDIFANDSSGIAIKEKSSPTLSKCRINRNQRYGIWVYEGGTATVTDCDLRGNKSGPWNIAKGCQVKKSGNRE